PPVQDAPKPVTPQRIHIGCGLQAAYVGPVPEWFNFPDSLSDEQIASLEWTLSANPNDTCARGYLIAHGRGHVPQRMDHVLWMIENHPGWDGFILKLSQPKSADERHEADRVRAAWLRQAGPDQRSGAELHNAATYFEQRDPDFAVELMERAIR